MSYVVMHRRQRTVLPSCRYSKEIHPKECADDKGVDPRLSTPIAGLMRRFFVTARLLPRRFCFDGSDEQLVVNKAVEEIVPFLGCAAGIFEHLPQFVHAVVCQCGHGFVVSGVHGDDATVAQIIIVRT